MSTQSYNTGNNIFDSHGAGSTVVADYRYITLLLDNIPDNTGNLIDAKDVRDAVWTLWNRMEDMSASFSASFSADLSYNRTRPSTAVPVGGVPTGSTFSGTIQDVLDRIFYPYTGPAVSLTGGGDRLFGGPLAVTFNYSINKFEKPISLISLTHPADGTSTVAVPSAINQNNTIPASFATSPTSTPPPWSTYATHSAVPGSVSVTNTFFITVSDTKPTITTDSKTVVWKNYLYYGTIDLGTLSPSNPDLSLRPDGSNSSAIASALAALGIFITPTVIKASSGTNNRPIANKQLAIAKTLSLSNFAAGGNYLFFAWPTLFGTPNFSVNNLPNTAFTKVKSNMSFPNEYGWTGANYDVWISNTAYGTATLAVS
jgi:hypothetical protein